MLKRAIEGFLKKNGLNLSVKETEEFGDYFVFLQPFSQEIFQKLSLKKPSFLKKIEFKPPGFLNFYLEENFLKKKIFQAIKKPKKFFEIKFGKGKKVEVEFISANPTGPLTLGNIRGGPFGDSLANLLKMVGYKVKKVYYVNDCGKQIIELGKTILGEGEFYKGSYIKDLKKEISGKDPEEVGKKAARLILKKFILKTLKKLGIKYDKFFFESRLFKESWTQKAIFLLQKRKLLYQKEGATWLDGKKLGLNKDFVLIKSDGKMTYLAGDIAFHLYKFKKEKYHFVVDIFGADHLDESKALEAVVEALGFKGKLKILLLQFVTLIQKGQMQKMSKREGRYVLADEILDKIGKDILRYFFLEKSLSSHLNFDLDFIQKRTFENPYFYLQYAYVRILSIFKKGKIKRLPLISLKDIQSLNHPSEISLLKILLKYPEVIEQCAKDFEMHKLVKYAQKIASLFHVFYQECQVIQDNQNLFKARVALLYFAREILSKLFWIMGITPLSKM